MDFNQQSAINNSSRPNDKSLTTPSKSSALKKAGLFYLVFVMFSYTTGGPFGLEDMVTTSGPGITLIFLLVLPFFWCIPVSLVSAELTTAMPVEGGFYRWTRAAFGDYATEGDYIKDFRKVVSQNGNSALNLPPDATGTAVSKWLQAVLNRKTYEMDLARSTRERKTKIDEVFVRGARGGIVDKVGDERDRWIAKWKGNFEKLGVDFDDFETDDVEQNVERLAMALYKFTLAKSAQQFS